MASISFHKEPTNEDLIEYAALEDAWNWFVPALPQNMLELKGSFKGMMIIYSEQGFSQKVDMSCFIKK